MKFYSEWHRIEERLATPRLILKFVSRLDLQEKGSRDRSACPEELRSASRLPDQLPLFSSHTDAAVLCIRRRRLAFCCSSPKPPSLWRHDRTLCECFRLDSAAFQKVPTLKALAPTQSEPPFLITQLVVRCFSLRSP